MIYPMNIVDPALLRRMHRDATEVARGGMSANQWRQRYRRDLALLPRLVARDAYETQEASRLGLELQAYRRGIELGHTRCEGRGGHWARSDVLGGLCSVCRVAP